MPNVLVRDVSRKTIDRLKSMARQHNRSLQKELKEVLENISGYSPFDISRKASEIRKSLTKKRIKFSDTTELLREDRCR